MRRPIFRDLLRVSGLLLFHLRGRAKNDANELNSMGRVQPLGRVRIMKVS
jgi:hypothetical protein